MGALVYSIIFTVLFLWYGIKVSLDEEKMNSLEEEKRVDNLENKQKKQVKELILLKNK